MSQMELNIDAEVRAKVLKESVLVFRDDEVDRKNTKTLESLVSYYESVLEAIGGKEIWQLFEHLAKAENVIADRRTKIRDAKFRKAKRDDVAQLRKINKVFKL